MIYKLKGKNIRVVLEAEQIDSMAEYIRIAGRNETGGILLGHYPGLNTASITQIIGPPSDSKSGRYWFLRGVKGLSILLANAWKKNEYYLGEWHYHPNGTTEPSQQDLTQMRKISKNSQYNCPEPVMIIISGHYKSYELGVFLTDRRYKTTFQLEKES
jgi:integrative and conjugative element protein (TIGR02256 family)